MGFEAFPSIVAPSLHLSSKCINSFCNLNIVRQSSLQQFICFTRLEVDIFSISFCSSNIEGLQRKPFKIKSYPDKLRFIYLVIYLLKYLVNCPGGPIMR